MLNVNTMQKYKHLSFLYEKNVMKHFLIIATLFSFGITVIITNNDFN